MNIKTNAIQLVKFLSVGLMLSIVPACAGLDEESPDEEEVGETASAIASSCSSGWFCLFKDNSFGGRRLRFNQPGVWENLGAYNFNDESSSLHNRTSRNVTVYQHAGCSGPSFNVAPGAKSSALGSPFQDGITSLKVR